MFTGTASKFTKPFSDKNVLKAALVGAKTVKLPGSLSVAVNPVFDRALTNVLRSLLLFANPAIELSLELSLTNI